MACLLVGAPAAQLLAISLLTWRGKGVTPAQQLLRAASGMRHMPALSPAQWRRCCELVLPVALMYLPGEPCEAL
jgi:hypothetical protein